MWWGSVGVTLVLLFAGVMYSTNLVMPTEVWNIEEWEKHGLDEYTEYLFVVRDRNLKWSVVFLCAGLGAALFWGVVDWYVKTH